MSSTLGVLGIDLFFHQNETKIIWFIKSKKEREGPVCIEHADDILTIETKLGVVDVDAVQVVNVVVVTKSFVNRTV